MQINFLLTPNDELDFMKIENEAILVPMFWLNETMQLDEETAQDVYSNSVLPLKIVNAIQYTLFAIGGALVLCSTIIIIYKFLFGADILNGKIEQETKNTKNLDSAAL